MKIKLYDKKGVGIMKEKKQTIGSYFVSIWSPKQVSEEVNALNWWQMILVFIFINALLIIPVSLYFSQQGTKSLQSYAPQVLQEFDETVLHAFQDTKRTEQPSVVYEDANYTYGYNLDETMNNSLSFHNDTIKMNVSGDIFTIQMELEEQNQLLKENSSASALSEKLSSTWFKQNKAMISFTQTMFMSIIIYISTTVLVALGTLAVWFARTMLSDNIKTIKNACNFVLNSLGLSTLVAMIISFFYFDVATMLALQSAGFLMMFFLVFLQKKQVTKEVSKTSELQL